MIDMLRRFEEGQMDDPELEGGDEDALSTALEGVDLGQRLGSYSPAS